MVRFPNGTSSRSIGGGNGDSSGSHRSWGGGDASGSHRSHRSDASSGSGYDPASRYDPTTMGRIADSDLDPDVADPEEELFDRANRTLDAMGMAGFVSGMGGGGGGGGRGGRGGSRGMRRCVLLSLTVAAVVGASVAIARTVQRGGFSIAAARGGSGSGDGTKKQLTLPDPPSDLSEVCSPSSIADPRGYRSCQALCVRAECCFLPAGHWFGCAETYPSQCATYEGSCSELDAVDAATTDADADATEASSGENGEEDGTTTTPSVSTVQRVQIPPAPADLSQLCSTDSLTTSAGYDLCSESCQPSFCCAESSEVCVVTNPDACYYYGPCSVLSGLSTPGTHPDSIASQVKAKCNTANLATGEGMAQCTELCEPAVCCFVPRGTGASGAAAVITLALDGGEPVPVDWCPDTPIDDSSWCDQYGACSTVLHVEVGGMADEEGGDDVVVTPNTDGFGSDEEATSVVVGACDHTETPSGRDRCRDVCGPAECCFIGMEGCNDQGLEAINCNHYEACYPYFDELQQQEQEQQKQKQDQQPPGAGAETETALQQAVMVPRPPPNLETVCAGGALVTPEGHQKCSDACSVAQCCVADIDVCRVANPGMCGAYEVHCAAVWDGAGSSHGDVTVPDPPSDLESKCGGLDSTDDGWKECDDACRPARCCDEDIDVCRVTNPHVCDAYEVHCAVVWGDQYHEVTIPDAPADLDRKCAGADLSDDRWATCDDACRPASCCDMNIDVCRVTNPRACQPYEVHCAEVWGDQYQEVYVPGAPPELSDVCGSGGAAASAGDGSKLCPDLCYMGKCCSESIEACRVLNPEACDAYEAPCAAYWGNPVAVTVPAPTLASSADVEEVASSSFGADGPSPDAGETTITDEGETSIMDLAEQVVEACSSAKVRDVQGRTSCEDLCMDHLCCFTSNEQISCFEGNEEFCIAFAACENLLET